MLLLVYYLYSISMPSGGLPFKLSALAFSNRYCFCACFVALSSSFIISLHSAELHKQTTNIMQYRYKLLHFKFL